MLSLVFLEERKMMLNQVSITYDFVQGYSPQTGVQGSNLQISVGLPEPKKYIRFNIPESCVKAVVSLLLPGGFISDNLDISLDVQQPAVVSDFAFPQDVTMFLHQFFCPLIAQAGYWAVDALCGSYKSSPVVYLPEVTAQVQVFLQIFFRELNEDKSRVRYDFMGRKVVLEHIDFVVFLRGLFTPQVGMYNLRELTATARFQGVGYTVPRWYGTALTFSQGVMVQPIPKVWGNKFSVKGGRFS
jgi:hypothetical protein